MGVCTPAALFKWELISDTAKEKDKFVEDARKLTAVIVSETGAMSHVADLLNIWGVFVPSEHVSASANRADNSRVSERMISRWRGIHLGYTDPDRN